MAVFKNNLFARDSLDLIAITESWLKPSVHNSELFPENYVVFRRDRLTRAGGVVLAVRADTVTHAERISSMDLPDTESLWVKLSLKSSTVFVCVIYVPPRSSTSLYYNIFEKIESNYNLLNDKNILILGDLNLPSCNSNIVNMYNYFKCFYGLQEYNLICNDYNNTLDVVLCNAKDLVKCVEKCQDPITNEDKHHPALSISISVAH